MRFRPDISTRLAVAVFVAAGCSGQVSPALREPNSPPNPPPNPPLTPMAGREPTPQVGLASYYAQRFAGRKTANGDRYDPSLLTAAHRTLPFGTVVEVRRRDGRRVVVRINDRGPFGDPDRVIDLSRRAAEQLGIVQEGKVSVELYLVSQPP